MSDKPTTINTLLLKLKGKSVISKSGVSDLDKINGMCDTFITNLKSAGVNIKDYNITVSLETDIVKKSADDEPDTNEEIVKTAIEVPEPETELCPVCMDDIDELSDTLLCGHKVHHDCIVAWYTDLISGGGCEGNKIPRTCPYCRQYGGYLDLHPCESFILGVHDVKFHGIPADTVKAPADTVNLMVTPKKIGGAGGSGDTIEPPPAPVKIKKSSSKIATNMWQCHGLTKKGKQCKKNKISGTNFCYIHLSDDSTT
jgi:hypothetical protein